MKKAKIVRPAFQDEEMLDIYAVIGNALAAYEADRPLNLAKAISALEIVKLEYFEELRRLNDPDG